MILGLDYGTSHIGVAIADGPLAEPLTTFPTSEAIPKIIELVKKYHIEKIIIGSGVDHLKLKIAEFVNSLKIKNQNLKIELVDETLSSHDARASLEHTSMSRRKSKEHSVAAAIILQSYLDVI